MFFVCQCCTTKDNSVYLVFVKGHMYTFVFIWNNTIIHQKHVENKKAEK